MPAGLHIVALSHIYGLDLPYAASAIVWTTMVAVPLLLVASWVDLTCARSCSGSARRR